MSASRSWLTVVGIPISISFLMTSAALTPMRWARSPTVTTSSIFSSRLLALGGTVEGAFFSRTGRPPPLCGTARLELPHRHLGRGRGAFRLLRVGLRLGEDFLDDRLLEDRLLHLLLVRPRLLPLLFLLFPRILRLGRHGGLFDHPNRRLRDRRFDHRLGGLFRRRYRRDFGGDDGLDDGRRRLVDDPGGRGRIHGGQLGGGRRGGDPTAQDHLLRTALHHPVGAGQRGGAGRRGRRGGFPEMGPYPVDHLPCRDCWMPTFP